MKKTNRKKDPAYDRLGTLPTSNVKPTAGLEDAMIGHFDADGDVITPPNVASVPAS